MTTNEAIRDATMWETPSGLKKPLLGAFEWFGGMREFCARLIKAALTPPYEGKELLRRMSEEQMNDIQPYTSTARIVDGKLSYACA